MEQSDKTQQPPSNKEEQQKPKEKIDNNVILIGSKPLINYIRSISVQLTIKKSTEVIIRSRGKFISKAVDIVEIARRKFLEKEGIKIKNIKISSEEFEKEGRKVNVSAMDIILGR
ncbi:RNA-binding protein [Candidatus Pacearchaeota archaeon]|nr:RNA-binding protein [Candidatus Pacearchaeota archaeon]